MFPPHWLKMALVLSSVPTHTAVESCGVAPSIQASLFRPVSPSWAVPVLAAEGRPPASCAPLEYAAMGSMAYSRLSATCSETRRSPLLSSNS